MSSILPQKHPEQQTVRLNANANTEVFPSDTQNLWVGILAQEFTKTCFVLITPGEISTGPAWKNVLCKPAVIHLNP